MSNLHLIIATRDEDRNKLDAYLATSRECLHKIGEGVYVLISDAHPEQVYPQVCKEVGVSGKVWIGKIGMIESFGS